MSPLLMVTALVQLLRGRLSLSGLTMRFARGVVFDIPKDAPRLWLHSASNGEVTSARSLIDEALARDPSLHVIVTTNSETARALVIAWDMARVHPCLAPLDFRGVVTRFLNAAAPCALIVIENEMWPNRFNICAARAIPVIVAGARMSERSAKRHALLSSVLGGTLRTTLNAITALAALDAESEQRFLQMGFPSHRLLPRMNLKSGVSLGAVDPDTLTRFKSAFVRDETLLAASTHEGEEKIVIAAFSDILTKHPKARLILAPRHPSRRNEVSALLDKAGLQHASRARADAPDATPVYLADTLGEMALWYQLAGSCFVGGSLVERGGHTPFEPEQFNSAIIHGPHVSNHSLAYRALNAAHGAVRVHDAQSLAAAWDSMLAHPQQMHDLAQTAHHALDPLRMSGAGYDAFWTALAKATDRTGFARKM